MPRYRQLIVQGALVPLTITSHLGVQTKLQAKIDTGSEYTVIEESLARQLQLVAIDQAIVNTVGQANLVLSVYRVEIEIPPLRIREWARVLGGTATLLGREQLRECRLEYDGPSGTVTLTK